MMGGSPRPAEAHAMTPAAFGAGKQGEGISMIQGSSGTAMILFGITLILFGNPVVSESTITATTAVVGVVGAAMRLWWALRAKA
jgi:hypothetical protein